VTGRGLLLWDFDGTLAFHSGGWATSMLRTLDRNEPEVDVSFEEVADLLWGKLPWHEGPREHPELSTREEWWSYVYARIASAYEELGIPPQRAKLLAREHADDYAMAEQFNLFEDTVPVLADLKSQGWHHGIVSNHVPELTEITGRLGLNSLVDFVHSSANSGFEKPHPKAFLNAIECAGSPQNVWMIGDDKETDYDGALAVGIQAILVRRPPPADAKYCPDLLSVAAVVSQS
jgi:putative hydrolase of the HAD superfamily